VDDSRVDVANFLETSPRNIDEMVKELRTVSAALSNGFLRQLMNAFLDDPSFMAMFKRTPAAKTLHHNYIGGLLEHIVELVALARDVAKHFPSVDLDLLTVGAFLHDIGKVKELAVRKSIEYTTEGRLIGHISLGYEMIVEKVRAIPSFPAELALLLKHIMLSHHGEYEFGSPKRPKIQEAIIINYLDDLEAKINNFQATIRKENVAEGSWTSYSKMHDRYLYRARNVGNPASSEGPGDAEETIRHTGKKPVPGGNTDASGKLPLDI
jgi:3'-5' exoribonuclease